MPLASFHQGEEKRRKKEKKKRKERGFEKFSNLKILKN
jgi:hypothetical protein